MTHHRFSGVGAALLAAVATASHADSYTDALNALTDAVRTNPLTQGAYWLEMQNVLDEWEKVVLIFGYAAPGDQSACEEIRALAVADNLGRKYRCVPVD